MVEVREHGGVLVVRDDFYAGGTKARFLKAAFAGTDELVYASPAEGGAQTALAHTAAKLKKRLTIFVAKRNEMHDRAKEVIRMGGKVVPVPCGYLSVVQAAARRYCEETGAKLLPFGGDIPEARPAIAEAARSLNLSPAEVWCAAGSGTLARGLAAAWPRAAVHMVQVGRQLEAEDVPPNGVLHTAKEKFSQVSKAVPPFPSDPHYDAKAWGLCEALHGHGQILFWNVTGPARP